MSRQYLDSSKFLLEHFQNQETGRHTYLKGLSVDLFLRPDDDRAAHYLARELMYSGRFKSAIREFERHIDMGGWRSEAGQSAIHIADCYGHLGNIDKQCEWYSKAYQIDSSRREALIKLARTNLNNKNYQAAISYATASLQIGLVDYYANNMEDYQDVPHSIIYKAAGFLGNIGMAQWHLSECLKYQPLNPNYLADTKYYFEYYDRGISGWMTFEELQFLYNESKKHDTICEVGSWQGRSSDAILRACPGTVTCCDTWLGSIDPRDDTNWMAKQRDIFEIFKSNTREFKNLRIIRKPSVEAAKEFADKSISMTFIDAGHDYNSVKEDIEAWLPKTKNILCGHDYVPSWMSIIQCVDEKFIKPDAIFGSIWVIDLQKRGL